MAPAPPPVDPVEFRRLMARWPTGVSVVTTRWQGVDAGLTVSALVSVSLAPPSLLVSLTLDADTTPLLERSRIFGVSALAADQRAVSERFAQTIPPPEKFRDLPIHRGPGDVPLLDGGLAAWVCRVVAWVPQYDHVLVIGEVVYQEGGREGEPLVYFRSGYAEPDGPDRLRLAARRPV